MKNDLNHVHRLNGLSDLFMDGDICQYIGTEVTLLKFTKGGLAYVRAHDGEMFSVPRRNLDPRQENGAAHNTRPEQG